MRKRGLIFILAAIPARVFVARFFHQARSSPFAYELGSMAWPIPPLVLALDGLAALFTLIGFYLLASDFIRWRKKKIT
jgi:hypothetical protein